jgi:hypothetical protein
MPHQVKLSAIVEAMDSQTDESYNYLNRETGEIVYVTDEEFSHAASEHSLDEIPEGQRPIVDATKKISESDKYIQLPDKFEIHEYKIMINFCISISDGRLRNDMYSSVKGSGAFRRFKDNIHRFDVADDWYRFREEEFYRIARDWCKYHEIAYANDFKDNHSADN